MRVEDDTVLMERRGVGLMQEGAEESGEGVRGRGRQGAGGRRQAGVGEKEGGGASVYYEDFSPSHPLPCARALSLTLSPHPPTHTPLPLPRSLAPPIVRSLPLLLSPPTGGAILLAAVYEVGMVQRNIPGLCATLGNGMNFSASKSYSNANFRLFVYRCGEISPGSGI